MFDVGGLFCGLLFGGYFLEWEVGCVGFMSGGVWLYLVYCN